MIATEPLDPDARGVGQPARAHVLRHQEPPALLAPVARRPARPLRRPDVARAHHRREVPGPVVPGHGADPSATGRRPGRACLGRPRWRSRPTAFPMWAVTPTPASSTPWGTAAAAWRCRFISAGPSDGGCAAEVTCRCSRAVPGPRCRGPPVSRRLLAVGRRGVPGARRAGALKGPRSRGHDPAPQPATVAQNSAKTSTNRSMCTASCCTDSVHCSSLPGVMKTPRFTSHAHERVEQVRVGFEEAPVVHQRLAPVRHAPLATEVDDVRGDVVRGDGLRAPVGEATAHQLEVLVGIGGEDLGERRPARPRPPAGCR